MLAEFDALGGIPYTGSKLTPPKHFPKWLNIYDANDILSYRAEPIFENVRDFQVDSVLSLFAAHSAYWKLPETWTEIRDVLASKA